MNMKSRKVIFGLLGNFELVALYLFTAFKAPGALNIVGCVLIGSIVFLITAIIGGVVFEKYTNAKFPGVKSEEI